MEGVPQTLPFTFDGPGCKLPSGALSATAVFTSPSGAPVALDVQRVRQTQPLEFLVDTVIELELAFPALARGTSFLQLFVEPGVAVIQIPVFVARDRTADAGDSVALGMPCQRPARTREGTTFCLGDSGFVAFRGSQQSAFREVQKVLVVGNVVWMLDGTTAQLRRYEDRPDGGLMLTAAGGPDAGFPARGNLVVDECAALLDQGYGNEVTRVDIEATGRLTARAIPMYSEEWLLEGPGVIGVSRSGLCNGAEKCSPRRTDETGLLGYDADFVWVFDSRLSPASRGFSGANNQPSRMALLRRPVSIDSGEAFATPIPPGWSPDASRTPRDVGGELPPLLYSQPDAGRRRTMLVRQTFDGTTFDVFPGEPIGMSRDWLIFPGNTRNELRVVALPLSP